MVCLGLLEKKSLLIGFGLTPYLAWVSCFRKGFFLGLLSCGEKETFTNFERFATVTFVLFSTYSHLENVFGL